MLIQFQDTTSNPAIWTAAEASITIICVSLPVLRPLWVKIRKTKSRPDSGGSHKLFNMCSRIERGAQAIGPGRREVTPSSSQDRENIAESSTQTSPESSPETSRDDEDNKKENAEREQRVEVKREESG